MILSLISVTALTQTTYPLKKVRVDHYLALDYSVNWLATSQDISVLFTERTGATLASISLSEKGKILREGDFFTARNGYIVDYDSVWTGSKGLLFILVHDNFRSRSYLYRVLFTAGGERIGKPNRLFMIKGDLTTATVRAGLGPESAAVAFAINQLAYAPNNFPLTRAFILETDLKGRRRCTAKELRQPSGNLHYYLTMGRPVWNGKLWLVPAGNTRFTIEYLWGHYPGYFYVPQGNDLMVISARNISSAKPKIRMRAVASDQNSAWPAFPFYGFLPDSTEPGAPARSKNLNLMATHITYLPSQQRLLEEFESDYFIIPIGAKGRKAGKEISLKLPKWKHLLEPDPTRLVSEHLDIFSDPLVAADGNIIIAHNRSISRFWWSGEGQSLSRNYDFDNSLELLRISPESRKVKLLAQVQPEFNGRFLKPFLTVQGDVAAVFNRLRLIIVDGVYVETDLKAYLSRFK